MELTPLLHWAQNNPITFLLCSLILIFLLKQLFLAGLSSKQSIFFIFLFPGVVLHEIMHIVACTITFAKVKSFKLFSKTGGNVIHEKPFIPIIGPVIISLAPLAGGIVFLGLIFRYGMNLYPNFTLQAVFSPKNIFYLYLSIAIIIAMLPSLEDLKNSYWQIFILFSLLFVFQQKIPLGLLSSTYLFYTLISCVAVILLGNIILFLTKSNS